MGLETLEPTAGGGGAKDHASRPTDFDDDDPRRHTKEVVARALSDIHLQRMGGPKPGYSDRMHPELARGLHERMHLVPATGEMAIAGFNIFEYDADQSPN